MFAMHYSRWLWSAGAKLWTLWTDGVVHRCLNVARNSVWKRDPAFSLWMPSTLWCLECAFARDINIEMTAAINVSACKGLIYINVSKNIRASFFLFFVHRQARSCTWRLGFKHLKNPQPPLVKNSEGNALKWCSTVISLKCLKAKRRQIDAFRTVWGLLSAILLVPLLQD